MIGHKDLFSLKFIKFIMVIIFLTENMSNYYGRHSSFSVPPSWSDYMSIFFLSLIPLVAIVPGLILRVDLHRYISGGVHASIRNKEVFFQILKVSIFLILAGIVRATIYAPWSNAFIWGYLHFIGLSYLLITISMYISIYFLIGLTIVIFFLSDPLTHYFTTWTKLVNPSLMPYFVKEWYNWIWVLVVLGCAELGVIFWFFKKWFSFGSLKKWSPKYLKIIIRSLVAIIFILTLIGVYQFCHNIFNDNSFAYIIFTLSRGIFFEMPVFHTWPIFPWFAGLTLGFVLTHFFLSFKLRRNFYLLVIGCLILIWSYYLIPAITNGQSFDQVVNNNLKLILGINDSGDINTYLERGLRSHLFSAGRAGFLWFINVYLGVFLLAQITAPLLRKKLFLHRLIDIYGQGIFVVYFALPFIIDPIIHFISKLLDNNFSKCENLKYFLIQALGLLLAYLISRAAIWVKNHRLIISFRSE